MCEAGRRASRTTPTRQEVLAVKNGLTWGVMVALRLRNELFSPSELSYYQDPLLFPLKFQPLVKIKLITICRAPVVIHTCSSQDLRFFISSGSSASLEHIRGLERSKSVSRFTNTAYIGCSWNT